MQERLLAPRMLHFGGSHVLWECAQLSLASDQYPHGMFEPKLSTSLRYTAPGALTGTSEQSGMVMSLYQLWTEVFAQYGQSRLSHSDKDKMVALEGVGKRIAEINHAKYLNGFMDVELPYALCWQNEHRPWVRPNESGTWKNSSLPSRLPGVLRGPSWHWSSSDQRFWYDLILRYRPYRIGNERFARSPLIWLLYGHGPLTQHLTRGTQLLCFGRILPVESYEFRAHQYLVMGLCDYSEGHPGNERRTPFGSVPHTHLLCCCDWNDLKVYESRGKAKLYLLPVYTQRHTGKAETAESKDVQRRLIYGCYRVVPQERFREKVFDKFDRVGFGGLILARMENGDFARAGAFFVKSSDDPWGFQTVVRAMRHSASRLIAIR